MANQENGTSVLKSKRFVVRMSLVGKNQVMKEKLTTLPCWTKYKSYTATNNIPMLCRDKELV
mgnify:CR=1 FL=1